MADPLKAEWQKREFIIAASEIRRFVPAAEFCQLRSRSKLVGHSNFSNLRRNLVGLTEPRFLIDSARRRQNHFGKKFPQPVSRQFALLRLRLFQCCNPLCKYYRLPSGERRARPRFSRSRRIACKPQTRFCRMPRLERITHGEG